MAPRRFSQGPPPLITQDKKPGEFTAAENARAYQLFRVLDQDDSGKISTREFKRFLAGERTMFSVEFDTSDVGIVFGLNKYGDVAVLDLEKHSPAAAQDELVLGLQLVSINSLEVKSGEENVLDVIQTSMQRSLDKPTTFTFLDPLMVIREYTRTVDIQTPTNLFTLTLTPGAINDYSRFVDEVNELFQTVPLVAHIQLEMQQQHSVTFAFYSTNGEPFQLLWGTGPTHGESVRYNLGFSALDTPMGTRHEGTPTSIEINLELTDGQLDILIAELFRLPNGEMREELEFDEFRDTYIKYFDLTESIQSLKQWAQWKFQFAALEDEMKRQKLEQRLRKERMIKRRDKNAAIYRAQKETRMKKMFVGSDGVKRVHRRIPEAPVFANVSSARRSVSDISDDGIDHSDDDDDHLHDHERSESVSSAPKTQQSVPITISSASMRKAKARAAAAARKQKMLETGRLTDKQPVVYFDLESIDQSTYHPTSFFYTHERVSQERQNDVRIVHPVFFAAEMIREPRRIQPNSVDLIRKVLGHATTPTLPRHTLAWATYPSPPISVGLVKRNFRDISKAYDNQEVCHPAIFGYRARWQSTPAAASLFTHPTLWGYSLERPSAQIRRSEKSQKRKVNPYRYLPGQACAVCGGGAPGCPLCWDPPGSTDILLDEAFNAKKERKRKLLRKARRKHQHEGSRASVPKSARNRLGSMDSEWARSLLDSDIDLSFSSVVFAPSNMQDIFSSKPPKYGTVPLIGIDGDSSDDDDDDAFGDDMASLAGSSVSALSHPPILHTKLTTSLAVQNFRHMCRAYFNVWIKAMPSGKIVKVYADKHDPVWHLYNMYNSSVSDGIKRGGVLVLACSNGIYPLDNGRMQSSDVTLGYYAYQIQLKAYGMTSDLRDVALLRFESVTDAKVVAMLSRYLRQNSTLQLDFDNLPVHDTLAQSPNLKQGEDPVQASLLLLLKTQYELDREAVRHRDVF